MDQMDKLSQKTSASGNTGRRPRGQALQDGAGSKQALYDAFSETFADRSDDSPDAFAGRASTTPGNVSRRADAASHPAYSGGPHLVRDERGLALVDGDVAVRADLVRLAARCRPGRVGGELIVKAAKVKGAGESPLAIDATAGLGEDGLLQAAAGFRVWMFERDPVIAALLEDGLARAAEVPELAETTGRIELFKQDSIAALPALGERPDVVALDPMFPARRKSAAVKKKFQLIHQLEKPCEDEEALLGAALAARPRKVVVKRPAKGPALAGAKPSYAITGKSVRYDVIVLPR